MNHALATVGMQMPTQQVSDTLHVALDSGWNPNTEATACHALHPIRPEKGADGGGNAYARQWQAARFQGQALEPSIAEDIGYAIMRPSPPKGLVSRQKLTAFAQENIKRFGVKGYWYQNADVTSKNALIEAVPRPEQDLGP